jgi:hypothetical protein
MVYVLLIIHDGFLILFSHQAGLITKKMVMIYICALNGLILTDLRSRLGENGGNSGIDRLSKERQRYIII